MRVANSFLAGLGASALVASSLPHLHVAAADAAAADDVVVLTKDSFAPFVTKEELSLVEFYAPWCGHCQALAPEYSAAATELKTDNIKLAKVDCTTEEELCQEQGVGGYPTLKVFRTGTASEYGGARKKASIVTYMKKQALPAVIPVAADNFTDFKTQGNIVLVSFASDSASAEIDAFAKVANKYRDSHFFGHVTDDALTKEAGVKSPSVVLYRKFDEPEVHFSGKPSDAEALEAFVRAESLPLVDEVGPDNFMHYAESGLPLGYYFTEPDGKSKEEDLEKLKAVAKKFRGKLNLVWIDAVKFVNHARGLNLQGDDWPKFAIQDLQGATKYPLEKLGDDRVASISNFVDEFVAGKLEPSIKSEPAPKNQDEPVHVLVADEFDQVVKDDKRDWLVEFYAPWCGHCKNLAPTYLKLGEKYESHKDKVVIAKMDATANDVPPSAGFQVQSFPTIKLKPAGAGSSWIDFNGDRTLEGFVEFLGLNAKNKVEVNLDESAKANETKDTPDAEPAAAPRHEEL